LGICENETTIDSHHGSAVELKNTCRRGLTQRLVSWSSQRFPKYGSKPKQGWRGIKMGLSKAI